MQFISIKSFISILILLEVAYSAQNDDKNKMSTFIPTNYFGECELYFRRPTTWGKELTVYAYNDAQKTELSSWPGKPMGVYDYNEDEDVYYGKFYCEYFELEGTRVIFSDGTNQAPETLKEGFESKEQGLFTEKGLESICHYKEVAPGKYIRTLVCDKI